MDKASGEIAKFATCRLPESLADLPTSLLGRDGGIELCRHKDINPSFWVTIISPPGSWMRAAGRPSSTPTIYLGRSTIYGTMHLTRTPRSLQIDPPRMTPSNLYIHIPLSSSEPYYLQGCALIFLLVTPQLIIYKPLPLHCFSCMSTSSLLHTLALHTNVTFNLLWMWYGHIYHLFIPVMFYSIPSCSTVFLEINEIYLLKSINE